MFEIEYVPAGRDGGAGGIRTLDTAFQPYNGLANRRLQPLGHSNIQNFEAALPAEDRQQLGAGMALFFPSSPSGSRRPIGRQMAELADFCRTGPPNSLQRGDDTALPV